MAKNNPLEEVKRKVAQQLEKTEEISKKISTTRKTAFMVHFNYSKENFIHEWEEKNVCESN